MNEEKPPEIGGLSPQYQTYERQKCFVAYTEQAYWSVDLLSACENVLAQPAFDLELDYARKHPVPDVTLRQKSLELIANARYGIYDLSYWQDEDGQWQMPRNVFIELGIAIALNRPTLLLRHASNRELELPECLKSVSGAILEFSGETTLRRALKKRLPQWVNASPDREWWNRYCIFGDCTCEFREVHPCASQWGQETLHCHIFDGPDVDREDFRAVVEEVLELFSVVKFGYLDASLPPRGYGFLLCTHCQTVRSSLFAFYRITSCSPPKTFIAIGMSIALEAQFEYRIPKILLTENIRTIPSLLSGYEAIVARNDKERRTRLRTFIPAVMKTVREATWKPRPLPFIETQSSGGLSEEAAPSKLPAKPSEASRATILFADNNQEFLSGRREFLEAAGYKVVTATSPDEARREALHLEQIDLAILDLDLESEDDDADISGLTLAQDDTLKDVPKIIMASFPNYQAVRDALRPVPGETPPAADFIYKRDGPQVMLQAVAEILSGRPTESIRDDEGELSPEEMLLLRIFGKTPRSKKPLDAERHRELTERIQDCFNELTPREVRILQIRFGLVDITERSYTLAEVGQKFGLTGERIRQIEASALAKLRHPRLSRPLREYLNLLIPEKEASEQPFSASPDSRTFVATFGLAIEEVLSSGELPAEVPTDYVPLCDWLEEDLRERLENSLGEFWYPEASKRDGEILSVRIAFQWQQDDQPNFGELGWWSLLELVPFE